MNNCIRIRLCIDDMKVGVVIIRMMVIVVRANTLSE